MVDHMCQHRKWSIYISKERRERQWLWCWKSWKRECRRWPCRLQLLTSFKPFTWPETFTYQKILMDLLQSKRTKFIRDFRKVTTQWKTSQNLSNSWRPSRVTEWCWNYSTSPIPRSFSSKLPSFHKSSFSWSPWSDFSWVSFLFYLATSWSFLSLQQSVFTQKEKELRLLRTHQSK